MKPLIYIAGPYGDGAPEKIEQAIEYAEIVYQRGGIPFVPHLFKLWQERHPKSYSEWMALDIAILLRCNGLLRIPGESPGGEIEVGIAGHYGIPFKRVGSAHDLGIEMLIDVAKRRMGRVV